MAVAIITGTSSGIGLATAVTLARAGHTVFAAMRDPARGDELNTMVAAEKLPVSIVRMNVDDDGSVAAAIDRVVAAAGHIDVLVNNAGIGAGGSIEEAPMEAFRRVMETNFFGGLRCIKAVLPGMRARRDGCIVNVTSVAGRFGQAGQGPYASSKWAFEALSECLAQEVSAFNIRVAIVEPGLIATPMTTPQAAAPAASPYPHSRRRHAWFNASLQNNPVSPYLVAEQIKGIVEGDSRRLRYPVGPDAEPLIRWRAEMSDERWVALGAASDAEWAAEIKQRFGDEVKL